MNLNSALLSKASMKRDAPITHVAQCRTCASEHRPEIEGWLLDHITPDEIIGRLPKSGLTTRNIVEHVVRAHLPLHAREVLEYRRYRTAELAEEISRRSTDAAIAYVERALLTVAGGNLLLREGRLDIGHAQMVKVIRMFAELDIAEMELTAAELAASTSHDEHTAEINRIFSHIETVAGDEIYGRVASAVAKDRSLAHMFLHPTLHHIYDDLRRPDADTVDPMAGRRRSRRQRVA